MLPDQLKAGDDAPDFELTVLDRKNPNKKTSDKIKLSSFEGKKPVVLFFGSYT